MRQGAALHLGKERAAPLLHGLPHYFLRNKLVPRCAWEMSLVARRALASVVRPARFIARPLSLNKNAYLVRLRVRARALMLV